MPCTKQLQQDRTNEGVVIRSEEHEETMDTGQGSSLQVTNEDEFPTVLTEFSSVVADTQQYMIASDSNIDQVSTRAREAILMQMKG